MPWLGMTALGRGFSGRRTPMKSIVSLIAFVLMTGSTRAAGERGVDKRY
jgi:hypothetical protein